MHGHYGASQARKISEENLSEVEIEYIFYKVQHFPHVVKVTHF